jgi:hypothetical protein
MDDKPKNETPKKEFNKLDLSQLESFNFGTQWTQEKPEKGGGSRPRDDRPRRDGPHDNRKDRRGFKRPSGPPGAGGGGPGGERRPGGGDRRPGGDRRDGERSPRAEGGGQDRRRGPGGPGGRGGYPPAAPYQSPHFDPTFYPEDVSFAALAKTIRASCRTFELFDIAKTVIGKNDRFVVVLDRKPSKDAGASKQPFYVSVPDGMPFESEDAAVNHVVQKHLDKFFTTEQVETDPPKGSFQVINKCGVTGELLGPPNYHLYTHAMQQHHATRLARMPFETFQSRIQSVREPEVVEAWLDMMKKVTRYTWIGDGAAVKKPTATTETESAPSAEAETTPEETPDVEAVADAAPSPEVANTVMDAAATSPDSAAPAVEEMAIEAAAVPVNTSAPTFDSLTEAKVFLLTNARDKAVRTYDQGRFHGRIIDEMPDGEIKRAVIGTLERQRHFPLDTANALRGRLRREGFTIFKKGAKGVSYVCAVKRKFRVPGQTFADSIDELINFIETHPMVKVSELPEKFLGISAVAETEGTAPSEAPAATSTVSPFAELDQPKVRRMHIDLRWLVTEGYVTEFIDGGLFAAPPLPTPKPKPAPTAKETPAAKAAPAAAAAPAEPEAPAETSAPEASASVETPAPAAAAAVETAPAESPAPAPESEVTPEPEPEPAAEVKSEPVPAPTTEVEEATPVVSPPPASSEPAPAPEASRAPEEEEPATDEKKPTE